jgi:hypothetical protein
MKKLSISLIAVIFALPSYATGIGASAQSADCVNGTLGTYEGESTLRAQWNANTINLDFYDGETKLSSGTCTYDGGIELPEDPTKEGYEFDGWKVRRAAAAPLVFDLTTLAEYIDENAAQRYWRGQAIDEYDNPKCGSNPKDTNISTCDDVGRLTGLQENEWLAVFSYGKVKGTTRCSHSGQGSQVGNTGTPTDDFVADRVGGNFWCWCSVTGFAQPNSDDYMSVVSSPWTFSATVDMGSTDGCARNCAYYCSRVGTTEAIRRGIYGLTQ